MTARPGPVTPTQGPVISGRAASLPAFHSSVQVSHIIWLLLNENIVISFIFACLVVSNYALALNLLPL